MNSEISDPVVNGRGASAPETVKSADRSALTPETLFDDPYPIYERLRREDPVHFFPMSHEWLITRWEDCWTAGKTTDVFVPSGSYKPLARTMGQPNILSMSGPDHLGLRGRRPGTPRSRRGLAPPPMAVRGRELSPNHRHRGLVRITSQDHHGR